MLFVCFRVTHMGDGISFCKSNLESFRMILSSPIHFHKQELLIEYYSSAFIYLAFLLFFDAG